MNTAIDSGTLKRTPLFERHVALQARMVPFAGWEMPVQYTGVAAEHNAVRSRAGVFDVSHMGELTLHGPDALREANRLITNDLSVVRDGQAVYTCCCNDQGRILDDLIVYRYEATDILVVCNASNLDKIARHFAEQVSGQCEFRDQSAETALLAVQGPHALHVVNALEPAFGAVDAALAPFRVARTKLLGIDCTLARTGYTGEDGVEIFCPGSSAGALWDALIERGRAHGLAPIGLAARDTLRLEARLSLYGNEIDETTEPFEAGLGWVVKLSKPDFVGKAALVAAQAAPRKRKLVGFEMTGRGIARHGYPLLAPGGEVVGICTSGAPGPTVGRNIGMGYLPAGLSAIGTEFSVDCRGKSIAAKVVETPFYKRGRAS
jgi:aminomethyltransferase